tara:strand:+ start:747 stop:944 length:198 start_codon:yes stop_codon:yes gene_type:complete
MKKFIMLMSVLFLTGCATLDAKILEMKLANIPWADDKPINLDPCPGCFHLGPLQYDEMLIALHKV